ncbi:MAG: SDR family oxidoreductase, partial [Anaerolineales bacterium]|nr:SDR family oxidoreductase [Anaerolineales bacterium]
MKNKQTALITGASGGIGYELARKIAQQGHNLVVVARSESKLMKLAQDFNKQFGVNVTVMVKDLAQSAAPDEIYNELQANEIDVDILVNNAGFASYGLFHELDRQKELNMMQVNMVALTHLTHLFLPGMVERGYGRILNIASTAAFQPGPLMAVYYATKAYVLSFSEAIANELDGTGVTVTALCPGPTESGFQARAAMEDSKLVQSGLMDAATVAKMG